MDAQLISSVPGVAALRRLVDACYASNRLSVGRSPAENTALDRCTHSLASLRSLSTMSEDQRCEYSYYCRKCRGLTLLPCACSGIALRHSLCLSLSMLPDVAVVAPALSEPPAAPP